MSRYLPLAYMALAVGLSGCAWKGTLGSLFDAPSTGADLPFSNVGLYAEQPPEPCERDDVPFEPPSGEPSAVMAFAEDGTFVYATSEAALRGESEYWVWRGNYKVSGDTVSARMVTPGWDSGYSRIVSGFTLITSGPESFYYEAVRYDSYIVRYGVAEDRPVGCFRQPFVLRWGMRGLDG